MAVLTPNANEYKYLCEALKISDQSKNRQEELAAA